MSLLRGYSNLPVSASELLSHWDASNGITKDGSDYVSAWADYEGANTLTQGTGASQPKWVNASLNGYPIVRFDGINDSIAKTAEIAGNKRMNVFTGVIRLGTPAALTIPFYNSSGIIDLRYDTDLKFVFYGRSQIVYPPSPIQPANEWFVFSISWGRTNVDLAYTYLAGHKINVRPYAQDTYQPTVDFANLYVGGYNGTNYFGAVDVAYMQYWHRDGVIDVAEIDALHEHLCQKYALNCIDRTHSGY